MRSCLAKKYEFLIKQLTFDSLGEVVLSTADYLHIRSTGINKGTNFFISETLNSVEIVWVRQLSVQKNLKHTWSFLKSCPQEKMVGEIANYLKSTKKQLGVPGFYKKFKQARQRGAL